MANITRIKASDPNRKKSEQAKTEPVAKPKDEPAKPAKESKVSQAKSSPKVKDKPKKPFILIRPFVAFFRYLRDAWKEIRQVRWPNRKATWKMVFAVLIYTAIFVVLISLLDLFFTWLFGLILGNN